MTGGSTLAVLTLTLAIVGLAVAILIATWLITDSERTERAERVRAFVVDRLGNGS